MTSKYLRVAVVALFLFGAAFGYSYTVAVDSAYAAEQCNCTTSENCPQSCVRGGVQRVQFGPCDTTSSLCGICKCY
jgi:hypothetical protein